MMLINRHKTDIAIIATAFTVVIVMLTIAGASRADDTTAAINYISADAVYLNVGKYAGLRIGSTVNVMRDGLTIAVLEVIHVSSHSASCRVIDHSEAPQIGDAITFVAVAPNPPPAEAVVAAAALASEPALPPPSNVISGYVAFQTVWQKDLSGTDYSSLQPALLARIKVANVGGTGGELRFRDRIRLSHRSQPPGPGISDNEWYHRLMELAFVYDQPGTALQWGVGRMIVPYVAGVGLIDGGYLAYRLSKYFIAGAAAGFDPDPIDTGIDFDRQRISGFAGLDYRSQQNWRFASTAALTGSYASSTISREFVYWQNIFSLHQWLSVFQSAEIDINRDWRKKASGDGVTVTNFYLTANAEATQYASVNFTYDSRKNVRIYDTMATPDSLFDDGVFDGFGGGLTLRLPRAVTLRGRAGIRYREDLRTNRYFSIYASAARLPWRGHAVSLRYAFAETRFTTGHRPAFVYRLPAGRLLRLDLTAGGYIYEHGTKTTSSFYGEAGAYHRFGRYFASGSYRQYFGGNLESFVLYAELGLNL